MGLFASCTKKASDPNPTPASDLPTVIADSAGAVKASTAKIYARIQAEGSSAVVGAGIAWGTSPNPTVFDHNVPSTGFGVGSFALDITGLTVNTTYYARAYATNIKGTQYSQQVQFTTREPSLGSKLAKGWLLTGLVSIISGVGYPNDMYASMNSCSKDNVYNFIPGGAYQYESGPTHCYSPENDILQSGTWSFSESDSSFTIYTSSDTTKHWIKLISDTQLKTSTRKKISGYTPDYPFYDDRSYTFRAK